jgi:2-C-methyl-D-erythritol 2,4-cyclodiphosphate synthase
MRIGFGYDIHRTMEGRPMILGGVRMECSFGLDGHSDADCLTHALADAILGALALPDIGHYFPNNDPSIAGMDSQRILAKAAEEAGRLGYRVGNVDCTVVAEQPKIQPYLSAMRERLAATLQVDPSAVGIKATTNERVDEIGKGLAIAAHAVCMLVPQ